MSTKNTALDTNSIASEYANLITTQSYSKKPTIEEVKIIEVKNFSAEDGYFMELLRSSNAKANLDIPDFEIKQVNYSKLLPKAIKGWHIHYNQEDIWFIPPDDIVMVGLVDLREDSPTKGTQMRIIMGNHKSSLLYIPRGVAHGCVNLTGKPATVIYFTNQHFNPENPDEQRLPWDHFGADFWKPIKG